MWPVLLTIGSLLSAFAIVGSIVVRQPTFLISLILYVPLIAIGIHMKKIYDNESIVIDNGKILYRNYKKTVQYFNVSDLLYVIRGAWVMGMGYKDYVFINGTMRVYYCIANRAILRSRLEENVMGE